MKEDIDLLTSAHVNSNRPKVQDADENAHKSRFAAVLPFGTNATDPSIVVPICDYLKNDYAVFNHLYDIPSECQSVVDRVVSSFEESLAPA